MIVHSCRQSTLCFPNIMTLYDTYHLISVNQLELPAFIVIMSAILFVSPIVRQSMLDVSTAVASVLRAINAVIYV